MKALASCLVDRRLYQSFGWPRYLKPKWNKTVPILAYTRMRTRGEGQIERVIWNKKSVMEITREYLEISLLQFWAY